MQNLWLKPIIWNDITRNERGICDWNIRALYRLGSLKAFARQVSVYEAFWPNAFSFVFHIHATCFIQFK